MNYELKIALQKWQTSALAAIKLQMQKTLKLQEIAEA